MKNMNIFKISFYVMAVTAPSLWVIGTLADPANSSKSAPVTYSKMPEKKVQAQPLKQFEKNTTKILPEDLMTAESVPLFSLPTESSTHAIISMDGKHYLYIKAESNLPTINDRLLELSDKYMAAKNYQSYVAKLDAFEKKRRELMSGIEKTAELPENKNLSEDKLEAKLKPEIDRINLAMKAESSKLQYFVDSSGNLVFGNQKELLISHYKDFLNDGTTEFKAVSFSKEEIAKGKIMEHLALTVNKIGADKIQKIIVVYSSPDQPNTSSTNSYDLEKLVATKDGKEIDLSGVGQ
ncbi:MAG: hypothetical protein JWQ35_1549 [Bacteriovoracaceae bacterium]|nr:hypothetical protein [Bacteriovoracaceae bacterium]